MGTKLLLSSHILIHSLSTDVGLFLLTAQGCSHLWELYYKIESRRKLEGLIGVFEVSSFQPLQKAEITLVVTDTKVTGQTKAALPRGLVDGAVLLL